eukprot:223729_1
MTALCKHVLPPIELHNIGYNIADDLNAFAPYVISSYQFIQSILNDECRPMFPIQVDVKIIPRQVKQLGTSFGSFEDHLKQQLHYIPNPDYFQRKIAPGVGIAHLAESWKEMWKVRGAEKG